MTAGVKPESPSAPARVLVWTIRIYQNTLSMVLPDSCRFHPGCSQYTAEAVLRFGLFKGSWLGFRRVLRCHPFHPGGYDPVPRDELSHER